MIDYYPKNDDILINSNLTNFYKNSNGYYLNNNTYKKCDYISKNSHWYWN